MDPALLQKIQTAIVHNNASRYVSGQLQGRRRTVQTTNCFCSRWLDRPRLGPPDHHRRRGQVHMESTIIHRQIPLSFCESWSCSFRLALLRVPHSAEPLCHPRLS